MCHPHRRDAEIRRQAEPPSPDLRAGDQDREGVVEALRAHAAAGRLEASELEQRVGAALGARTLGELEPLLGDLPPLRVVRRRRRSALVARRAGQRVVVAWVVLAGALLAAWAAAGAGAFWPGRVLLGALLWGVLPVIVLSRLRLRRYRREQLIA
jgi:hypothetical protein